MFFFLNVNVMLYTYHLKTSRGNQLAGIQWAVMPSTSHPVSVSTIGGWWHDTGLHACRPLQRLPLAPCQSLQLSRARLLLRMTMGYLQ